MDVCYARDREAYRNLARVARFPALLSARQETSTKVSPLLSYWKPPRGLLKAGYPWALQVEHDATDEAMGEQGDRCGNDRGSAAMVRRGVRATVRQRRAGELFRQYLLPLPFPRATPPPFP